MLYNNRSFHSPYWACYPADEKGDQLKTQHVHEIEELNQKLYWENEELRLKQERRRRELELKHLHEIDVFYR